jgi:hypothetical protein
MCDPGSLSLFFTSKAVSTRIHNQGINHLTPFSVYAKEFSPTKKRAISLSNEKSILFPFRVLTMPLAENRVVPDYQKKFPAFLSGKQHAYSSILLILNENTGKKKPCFSRCFLPNT